MIRESVDSLMPPQGLIPRAMVVIQRQTQKPQGHADNVAIDSQAQRSVYPALRIQRVPRRLDLDDRNG